MATIIERERAPSSQPVIVESSSAGWAVALVLIVAVIVVGAFVWTRYYSASAPSTGDSTVNVTIPSADTTGTGGNASTPGGATGGATIPGY